MPALRRAIPRTHAFGLSPLAIALALLAPCAQAQTPAQILTLDDALTRVLASDPSVAANAASRQVAGASITQAETRPRDTVGVELEDLAGTGAYSPFERSQATAWYERTWESGGKRQARIDAARSSVAVVEARNRLRLLDLFARVQLAWIDALAAEAAIPIAQDRLDTAQRTAAEVDRRVARALDPLFAAERAKTSVVQARIALDQARDTARSARAGLAAYWGGTDTFTVDRTVFTRVSSETVGTAAPDLNVLSAERDAAQSRFRLAQTGDKGDPTGRVGVRHFAEGNNFALMVGGSIPLGNRAANRGNITKAEAEQLAAETEMTVARTEIRRETDRLLAEQGLIAKEIARIDSEVLPSARRAVTLVRDGFARGGTAFTFLEVSQAQDAVFDAEARRIDLLRRFHLTGARLDRLTGRHLPLLSVAEVRP